VPAGRSSAAESRFFSERLRSDHDVSRFSCGQHALDEWLKRYALNADRAGTGRTYVWTDQSGEVVAYYTLAPHIVRRAQAPARVARGSPDAIPSILLGRLALHRSLQGHGWGGALLADALTVALEAIQKVGGRLITVDAIDRRAAAFYQHFGFLPVPGRPSRLVIKASTAAKSLSLRWP
jgi:GNAT superfamily N-acetyltransferase